ncbi:hypothetical protein CYMTET_19166 [Cymbomonas tetramitiformis]|uniref:5-hmdU DNA kinase helical domain-containing protein n=1 Tax=Cymbomonas tetramitiformis TaxID=36881 RepID=A0AAE0G6M0_9CHLO|nr:hypothetical protein CYMTET_19166 [Cymbomonas tetramitiformis]
MELKGAQVDEKKLQVWFAFIRERFNIYLRRQAGQAAPWTEDAILREWRFCNVFREHDVVTKFVMSHLAGLSGAQLVLNACCCRLLNKVATIARVGVLPLDFDPQRVAALMGPAPFGGAYIIPSMGAAGAGSKPSAVCMKLAEIAETLRRTDPLPCHDALHALIKSHKYMGDFLAYQCCIDVGYVDKALYDEDAHVVLGPGAARGLRWLFPAESPRVERVHWLLEHQPVDFEALFMESSGRPWGPMSVENCLCEGDKYFRGLHRGKSLKRRYDGTGGTSATAASKQGRDPTLKGSKRPFEATEKGSHLVRSVFLSLERSQAPKSSSSRPGGSQGQRGKSPPAHGWSGGLHDAPSLGHFGALRGPASLRQNVLDIERSGRGAGGPEKAKGGGRGRAVEADEGNALEGVREGSSAANSFSGSGSGLFHFDKCHRLVMPTMLGGLTTWWTRADSRPAQLASKTSPTAPPGGLASSPYQAGPSAPLHRPDVKNVRTSSTGWACCKINGQHMKSVHFEP